MPKINAIHEDFRPISDYLPEPGDDITREIADDDMYDDLLPTEIDDE